MLTKYRDYLNSLTNDQLEQEAVIYWGIDDIISDEESREELIEVLVAKDEESENGH